MARILLADDGIEFDGQTPGQRPLGGVESSIVNLTQELAKRGHEVFVRNKCRAPLTFKGVHWHPIDDGPWPGDIDLYIANRGDKLIKRMPAARRSVFWIHNPAGYLLKWRYLWKLWQVKPAIVFIGDYHATTYPAWAPGGERIVIPYGMADEFCQAQPLAKVPPPRAIFTSNPLRSLDWLMQLWAEAIEPRVPGAELHLFTGAATYGAVGDKKAALMAQTIERAEALAGQGVRVRGPVSKPTLIEEFTSARCMLYRGDINETFCLAVGEAQASGVPAVVTRLGSVVERVRDSETGFIASSDQEFVDHAVELLSNESLWRAQHEAALALQKNWRWPDAAARFEQLLPAPGKRS
ncbi:MAG: glycosyltransferase family 4 protein [Rhodospirillales bacterium]|nr:glycosyltransferase family 4 protein [Rhodospirillales bacterium]